MCTLIHKSLFCCFTDENEHNLFQVRHGRFKGSPVVGDSSLYTGYEVSRSPEEWTFVQDLLPTPVIRDPTAKTEYPSGWRPQNRKWHH